LRQLRDAGDDGFTLIELAIVLVILPLVVGGVTVAVITSFKDSVRVATRITDSADSQAMAAYFGRDVQSALCVTTDETAAASCGTSPATSPHVCPSGTSGTATLLLALEVTLSGTSVSYWEVASSGTHPRHSLVRTYCTAATHATPHSTAYLALDAASGGYKATVTCTTASPPLTTPQPACKTESPTSRWITTGGISSVALSPIESGSKYRYLLEATPRTWSSALGGTPSGSTPYPPLTLLSSTGGGTCVLCLHGTKNQVLVTGVATNTHTPGAVKLTGNTNVFDRTATGATPTYFHVYDCGTPCTVVEHQGTNNVWPHNAKRFPTRYPPPSVPEPATTGLPTVSCTNVSHPTYECPAGVYTGAQSFSKSHVRLTSSNSTYVFKGAVSVSGAGSTITFGTGNTVVFENGFSVTSARSRINGSGVFFYVAGGAFDISAHVTATLSPPTKTEPYAGILLFEASPDHTTVTITGGNAVTTYAGELEAPDASITLGGGTNPMIVGSVIAQTLTLGGSSGSFHIGSV
jgi:prepilin-type N-terminal cleavage/methylation domain-containing protein